MFILLQTLGGFFFFFYKEQREVSRVSVSRVSVVVMTEAFNWVGE